MSRVPVGGSKTISGCDNAAPNGISHQPSSFMDVKLVHNIRAMRIGGFGADIEHCSDFLCSLAFGDQLDHLPLSSGERVSRGLGFRKIGLNNRARDACTQVDLTLANFTDRLHEFARGLDL